MKQIGVDVKVGFFILAGFVALFYLSFKIGTLPMLGGEEKTRFHIQFNTISGVAAQSKVRMQGYPVGEVEGIELKNRKVIVTVLLTEDVKIPVDSVASVQTSGLMGERFINIMPGMADKYIENGGLLRNSVDPVSMDEIMAKLSDALDDVKKFTGGLGQVFGEDGSMEQAGNGISRIMANMERASELLKDILEENRSNIKHGFSNVRSVSGNLDEIIQENRENFNVTMKNLRQGSEKLDKIMHSIEGVTAKLEKGEGTIGRLVQEEDVYDNINKTLAGAQGFIGKAEKIKLGLGLRAEHRAKSRTTKSYFSMRIKPREDKYYMLEVTEDVRKKGVTNRNALNSLLYSFIINKRYGDVGLEAGLMESSGGVGLDYFAFRDALRVSADMFNLSGYDINAKNPQLKLEGRFYFQRYAYLYFGGDEMLNNYYKTFYGGLGLMVDEDDFKFFFSLL